MNVFRLFTLYLGKLNTNYGKFHTTGTHFSRNRNQTVTALRSLTSALQAEKSFAMPLWSRRAGVITLAYREFRI